MSLHDIGNPTPLNEANDDHSIRYLTLDPTKQWLYWWNREDSRIEGQDLDSPGSGVRTLVTEVHNISGDNLICVCT